MKKIVITKLNDVKVLFLFDEDHEVSLIKVIKETLVDTIFMGQICEINEGLRCCFVSVAPDQKIFLSLEEFGNDVPKCGSNILVQIKTDALKTKLPQGSLDICLPGKFCVCHMKGKGISVSKKLDSETQNDILNNVQALNVDGMNDFKWVLRTNSSSCLTEGFDGMKDEMEEFITVGKFLKNEAKHRSLYSKLYSPSCGVLNVLRDISFEDYDSIVTDQKDVYDDIVDNGFSLNKEVKLYTDEYVSLKNLHSLETYLARALERKVYLDCGGYIIIEPTEAMTVIDVNSGKAEGKKKDTAQYLFKVNKEAALEIAKQLKIRNISGMIMVDFINMTSDSDNDKLMTILDKELKKDRIKTTLVDMTPLGIVEITRKKVDSSLDKAISL